MEKLDKIEHVKIVIRAELKSHSPFNDTWLEEPLDKISILDKVYMNSDTSDQDKIIYVLLNFIDPQICYLNFEFLIRKRKFKEAFDILKRPVDNEDELMVLYRCFSRLSFVLEDNSNFTLEEIEELRTYLIAVEVPYKRIRIKGEGSFNDEVSNLKNITVSIMGAIASNLVDEIYSGQIYVEDIKNIELFIGAYKLDKEFSSALDTIRKANPQNEHEYAKDSSFVRTFLENMIKNISKKIAQKYGAVILHIPDKSELTDCKSYLKSIGVIDESENKLINAIYDILSADSGSHVLTTPKEKYRLLVNMTIEILTLLLSNVQSRKIL